MNVLRLARKVVSGRRGRRVGMRVAVAVGPLEGRALLASLAAGPVVTPAVQIALTVAVNPGTAHVADLIQGVKDLFRDINVLVTAANPTDAQRAAVEADLAAIAKASGTPGATAIRNLTVIVGQVASSGTLTDTQQTVIVNNVGTILREAGVSEVVIGRTLIASPLLSRPSLDPSTTAPVLIGGPFSETLGKYSGTRGQGDDASDTASTLFDPSRSSTSSPVAPDASGSLIRGINLLLRTSQAAPSQKAALVNAIQAYRRDLAVRPDFFLLAQLRGTIRNLGDSGTLMASQRSTLSSQLDATIRSTGLAPVESREIVARTLDIADAPGLAAEELRSLIDSILTLLNSGTPIQIR